jgi:hypothetical protein
MAEFVFDSVHQFYWSNRQPVPIAEVADTLLALERVVRCSPKVLAALTQTEIAGLEVYVSAIESGSLLETIAIRLLFKDEENLNKFLDRIRGNALQPGMTRNLLIGTVFASLVGYGAWLAAKVSNPPGQTTINASNNTIINLGAGQVELTPEAFRAIVEAAVADKKDLAKSAVRLFNPARADAQASIVIDGNEATTFSPAVISATPRTIEKVKDERVEHLMDVDLQIRATDLDSLSRGWAALIPGHIDRRVKLKLEPDVKPIDIADKFSVRADVSVYYRQDRSGKKIVPDYILLHRIVKD